MTVEQRITTIVNQQLGLEGTEVAKPEHDLFDDLGADSLDGIEMLMAIEEEFAIDIDDATAETVRTVQQAVDLVTRLTA